MNGNRFASLALCTVALALGLTACGSSKSHKAAQAGGGATAAEAKSTATGDIPDSQVFLTFKNAAAGYSITYPEGWARKGAGNDATFQDKDNQVHILVKQGSKAPAPPGRVTKPAHRLTIHGLSVEALTYATESAPNPVTGKRVKLTTDRYVYPGKGRIAVLDLASPIGVDNVDAYRMISESFRWK
jgi:hypothetical protein